MRLLVAYAGDPGAFFPARFCRSSSIRELPFIDDFLQPPQWSTIAVATGVTDTADAAIIRPVSRVPKSRYTSAGLSGPFLILLQAKRVLQAGGQR